MVEILYVLFLDKVCDTENYGMPIEKLAASVILEDLYFNLEYMLLTNLFLIIHIIVCFR